MIVRMFAESEDIKSDKGVIQCFSRKEDLKSPTPIMVCPDDLAFCHYENESDTVIYYISYDDIDSIY